jgi:hypothetical protein
MSRLTPRTSALALGVLISLFAVALCAASASARKARAGGLPRVPQGFVGMVIDGPVFPDGAENVNLAHQLDVMVASGVQTLRADFDWRATQPYQDWSKVPESQRSQFVDAGGLPTRFGAMDRLVGLAAQRGLTVLPVILNAPEWDAEHHSGALVSLPKSDYWYASFAQTLVHRYGPRGDFWRLHPEFPKVPIQMWQLWNEPNILPFWPVQPFMSRYVALLRVTRRAIKSVDPSAKIVLAGMPNYSWIDLHRIYKAGGRGLFDIVAIHPYTRRPQGVITILTYVRQVMNQAGDSRKPIIADEVSWPSSLGKTFHNTGYDFASTESGQARNLAALLPLLDRARRRLGLQGFYYYTWAGLERREALAFEFAGLFRFNSGRFVPKPAYQVFRREALAMEGCRQKGPVATRCLRRE